MLLEVCVDNAESVRRALAGGADRVELCAALSEGGLTPSIGFVDWTAAFLKKTHVQVVVMIRNRKGDFVLDEDDIRIMKEDIKVLGKKHIHGFVLGALLPDGNLDVVTLRVLLEGVDLRKHTCTLHRCIDQVSDVKRALSQAYALGFRRVLSSGGMPNCNAGAANLRRMREYTANKMADMKIVAGAGLCGTNAERVQRLTQCEEYHGSFKMVRKSTMRFDRKAVQFNRAGQTSGENLESSAKDVDPKAVQFNRAGQTSGENLESSAKESVPAPSLPNKRLNAFIGSFAQESAVFDPDYDYHVPNTEMMILVKMQIGSSMINHKLLNEVNKPR
ncbi:MAG: uncharacterized protein KVP18_002438 [Porospora cf. gigantea A]|uniref:uncharacterized protein n=1 Tax=Porospora cf. gigantea A TaxID=2853593 RepID=UPI00355A6383|nr:MAG: hypothetical protein KVP18_002438 [Porospora cf. gigantea A]